MKVRLLTVVDAEQQLLDQSWAVAFETSQSQEEIAHSTYLARKERAERDLLAASEELKSAAINAESEIVDGLAGTAILDAAERYGADAIIMATRGHGGLGREVLGSTAEYVLRHAGATAVVLVGPRAAISQ
jgi:nucleotide-binding universal stress UspA family protein